MTAGYLERVWRSQGAAALRAAYRTIARRSRDEAARALADAENSFSVIYILATEAERVGLENALPPRAKYGIWLAATKAGDSTRAARYAAQLTTELAEPPYDALVWIIHTGADWDGPRAGRDDYDAALDLAAAYFAANFDDEVTLALIAKLVFRRNRKGLFIHDLVWGLFQGAGAPVLAVVARYIVSDDRADSELACKLLGLEMPATAAERVKLYAKFTEWLGENGQYIYLTGEHFNATSKPQHHARDEEARYIGRKIHPRTRTPESPLTDAERAALEAFRAGEGCEV